MGLIVRSDSFHNFGLFSTGNPRCVKTTNTDTPMCQSICAGIGPALIEIICDVGTGREVLPAGGKATEPSFISNRSPFLFFSDLAFATCRVMELLREPLSMVL